MFDILLIADQARLEHIVSDAAKACNAHLHHISSLTVPEEIQSASPEAIFIQNRLSGLSGDILARHLRSLFNSTATSLIILSDDPEDAQRSFKFADKCINSAAGDAEVARMVTGAITSRIKPGEAAGTKEDGPEPAGPALAVSDRVSLSGEQPPPEPPQMDSPFLQTLTGALSDLEPVPLQPPEETRDSSSPISLHAEAWSTQKFTSSRDKFQQRIWLSAGITMVLAVSFYFFTDGKPLVKGKPLPSAAIQAPSKNPMPGGMTALPAFIPASKPDATYGAGHAGWERYLGTGSEFRVFRRDGIIKALQIIDRSGKGLSETFMGSVLRQCTGAGRYTIATAEAKGTYMVEKGAADKAGIIVYRQKSDRRIKAFVLYFQ
ncbi:hypothetical protein [Geotalea sp. SG265]|uniref:hypothetical protein n=1 Tax=Geotalea sp. SG265 TaxID=2922867 RepID=UPI001FAF2D1C|nr:hypothetical protein [Geotalea sp. SG265]